MRTLWCRLACDLCTKYQTAEEIAKCLADLGQMTKEEFEHIRCNYSEGYIKRGEEGIR